VVQGIAFLAVNGASVRNARRQVDEALAFTADAFARSLEVRETTLLEKARLLSSDFAFKEASATGEHATLLSVLENHRERIAASVMMLASMGDDPRTEGCTLHPEDAGVAFPLPQLLAAAQDSEFGEASSIEFLDDRPHQLVVTPLFMPEPEKWIVLGFPVDEALARRQSEGTGTEVSLLRMEAGRWVPFASTLPEVAREELGGRISPELGEAGQRVTLEMAGLDYVTWVVPARSAGETRVAIALQRSLDEALAPYLRLRALLVGIFALGVLLSLAGGALLASRVTRPVARLVEGAARIEQGDYTRPVEVAQRDELGVLADSFNRMTVGLAERDRVRNLLGMVVSPAVAEELLSKKIELGGEERLVSVLFTDVRNFTSLSERTSPQELVSLLNTYLTRVSDIVEAHEGVVDKYIGDAVMAVFGAPLSHPDDALRAVRTATAMAASVDAINGELGLEGDARVGMGVGVSTGVVVAGNMGSLTRLNYTVIGDSVNVASRLEGLTKQYGVAVIVGKATRNACAEMAFRELDRVRVKGRAEALSIFEPWGEEAALDEAARAMLQRWNEALECFRARAWDRAEALFAEFEARDPGRPLHALYRGRIARFRAEPPGPDWDGTTTWQEK
jgi:adenylate cyclase